MAIAKRISGATRGGRGITMTLEPADEQRLRRLLETMSVDMKKKITRKALRQGGKIFIMEVKHRSPSDRVEKGVKGISRTVAGVPGYLMGPSEGLPNPAWMEYGTNKEYKGYNPRAGKGYTIKRTKHLKLWDKWVTLPSGKHINTGIKPRPFIKPAWDAKQNAVLTKMEQVIKTEIEKIR